MDRPITSAAAQVSSFATNAPGLGSMETAHPVAGLDGFTGLNQWCQLLNVLQPSSRADLKSCFHYVWDVFRGRIWLILPSKEISLVQTF